MYSSYDQINNRKQRQQPKRTIGLFFFVFIILLVGLFMLFRLSSHTSNVSKTSLSHSESVSHVLADKTKSDAENNNNNVGLANAVRNALIGTTGSYAVVVMNLHNKESYASNEHLVYESGSLYKLWVMATAFEQIDSGIIHKADILTGSIPALNKMFNIEADSAEETSGTITLSLQDAIYQMITISDNNAALLLTEKIKLANITALLTAHGFAESKVGIGDGEPTTTASDIALFLANLYRGKLADSKSSNEMITLLKEQKLNSKIPKYLPDDITVAHKTGELDAFTHDAGIIYSPNGDYILVVLSKSDNPSEASERIADVSQAVYNYFTDEEPVKTGQ